jgi:ech hydrogenase subunit A
MLFFWTKWMGKLIAVTGRQHGRDKGIGIEWTALSGLALLTILSCALYPLVGYYLLEPLYGYDPMLSRRAILMVAIMLGLMLMLPMGFFIHWRNLVHVAPYLSGANVADPHQFMGSMGSARAWSFRNYYIDQYFSEEKLFRGTVAGSMALMALMFLVANL